MSRFFRIILYLTLMAGMIWYGRHYNPFLTLAMCLAEPEKYHGACIEVANETIVFDFTAVKTDQGIAPSRFIYDAPNSANTYSNFLFKPEE